MEKKSSLSLARRSPNIFVIALHGRRCQQTCLDIIHAHAVHAKALYTLDAALDGLEARLVTARSGLDILHPLLDILQSLLDAEESLCHLVAQAVQLVGEGPNRRGQWRTLLAWCAGLDARLVVVSRLLQGESPLVAELHLADGLCAEGAVDLARRRVALLGSAAVLDAATVANEVVPRGLAIAVIGRSQLDYAVSLILCDALD